MEQKQREKNTAMLEWFDALVFALTFVLIAFLFFIRSVTVEGESMLPTLEDGQQVIVLSTFYTPKRGDIVVVDGYTSFGVPLIKRVIGVGNDIIDIDFETGDVFVNGNKIDEPYISAPTTRAFDVSFPLVVPEGKLFLLGDNRPHSTDSRHSDIGLIDSRDILGKVVLRILPLDSFGGVE